MVPVQCRNTQQRAGRGPPREGRRPLTASVPWGREAPTTGAGPCAVGETQRGPNCTCPGGRPPGLQTLKTCTRKASPSVET